jgi:hypothetical protein
VESTQVEYNFSSEEEDHVPSDLMEMSIMTR